MKRVFQVISFNRCVEGTYRTEKRAQEKVEELKSTYNYPPSQIKILIKEVK